MSTSVYSSLQKNIVESSYDENLQCIITKWYSMIAIQDLEPCYRAIAKAIQMYKPYSVIMDTSEAKNTIRTDDLDWIDTFYFPRAVHYGAKDMIIIPPTSSITKEAMKEYIDFAEKQGLTVHVAENYENAIKLAKSITERNL